MPFDFATFSNALNSVIGTVISFWWLWGFVILAILVPQIWLVYRQEHWRRKEIKWVFLELRIPREIKRPPRAMEQVFMSLHSMKNNQSGPKEKWLDGEVTMWFSAEIASFGGEIHFYFVTPDKHRNAVEAAFYAQYPDIEIVEVAEDYCGRMPATVEELQSRGYNIFGNELRLEKPDAYPIRTYFDFEVNVEEKELDPLSALLEMVAKVKPQETIWVQILFRPTVNDDWKKAGEELVQELKEKSKSEVITPTGKVTFTERSPGEMEIMKAVERNLSKPGFDTLIRYIYMAPNDIYSEGFARRGIYSAFNQYAVASLNQFKHNVKAWTRASWWYFPYFFPKRRKLTRQKRIYGKYLKRWIYDDPETPTLDRFFDIRAFHFGVGARKMGRMVLNAEELATIFHLPTRAVLTGPLIKRVESRKTGPPAGLPIYGEEGEELPGVQK